MTSKDQLSVVTYDDHVCLDFGLLKMDASNKKLAYSKIKAISAGSNTNLCDGLMKGLCLMVDRTIKNEVASVLLFTDGFANRGISHLHVFFIRTKYIRT